MFLALDAEKQEGIKAHADPGELQTMRPAWEWGIMWGITPKSQWDTLSSAS